MNQQIQSRNAFQALNAMQSNVNYFCDGKQTRTELSNAGFYPVKTQIRISVSEQTLIGIPFSTSLGWLEGVVDYFDSAMTIEEA